MKYDNTGGSCKDNFFCLNSVDENGHRFAECVDVSSTSGQRKAGSPQVGLSDLKRAATSLRNSQLEYSVKIEEDFPAASVSAVVQSEYLTFDVHPSPRVIFLCS